MYPLNMLPDYIFKLAHCFKGGGPGAPPPPPAPPRRQEAVGRTAENLRKLRKRKGFESTILTGGQGTAEESVIRKSILGE